MAKSDRYDLVVDRLNVLEDQIIDLETRLVNALNRFEQRVDKRKSKKAKDLPLGTKVTVYGLDEGREADDIYEVIAHSKTCDDVVILENDSGDITAENADDLEVV